MKNVDLNMAPIKGVGKETNSQSPLLSFNMESNRVSNVSRTQREGDIGPQMPFDRSRYRHSMHSFDNEEEFLHTVVAGKEFQDLHHRQDERDRASSVKFENSSGVEMPDFQISQQERDILHSYLSMHKENMKNLHEELEKRPLILRPKDNNKMKVIRDLNTIQNTFVRQAIVMSSWFILSFFTIVLNKYILSSLGGDIGILAECQLLMTTAFGFVKIYVPCYFAKWTRSDHASHWGFRFFRSMCILGWLRFGSVVCSVVSLKYLPVSFSETIKSSAPIFTVIIAYIILGEYSGLYTNLSLVPIMFGLGMCFWGEVTFSATGFIAALCNNILDCIQNVFSKKLLSGEDKYNPLELQFYTSVAASVVQLPLWVMFMDVKERVQHVDQFMVLMLLINGLFFYLQSVTAYLLMSLISPVTFSVSSTVKRASMIWFSVIVFGNQVTITSAVGTVLVVIGVCLYQRARHVESSARERKRLDIEPKKSPI